MRNATREKSYRFGGYYRWMIVTEHTWAGLHASDGQPQFYPHKWRPLRLDERIGFCSEDSPYNKCLKEDTDKTEKGR